MGEDCIRDYEGAALIQYTIYNIQYKDKDLRGEDCIRDYGHSTTIRKISRNHSQNQPQNQSQNQTVTLTSKIFPSHLYCDTHLQNITLPALL